jgi:hypothetical protein
VTNNNVCESSSINISTNRNTKLHDQQQQQQEKPNCQQQQQHLLSKEDGTLTQFKLTLCISATDFFKWSVLTNFVFKAKICWLTAFGEKALFSFSSLFILDVTT